MSRDLTFGVDGKTFFTKTPTHYKNDTLHDATQFNRIRENEKYTFKYRLIETSDMREPVKFIVKRLNPQHPYDYQYTLDPNTDQIGVYKEVQGGEQSSAYSYLRFHIGGNSKPTMSKVEIQAYYGDLNPERLDQNFVFRKYNGYTLRKMPVFSRDGGREGGLTGSTYLEDEYRHYTYFDIIDRKIGVLNLKDVTEWGYVEHDDNAVIMIPVPKDCKFFGDMDNKNLMSSNLCDIKESEATSITENKPFFVKGIAEVRDHFKQVLYEHGKPVFDKKTGQPKMVDIPKQCFQILLDKEFSNHWREHLAETQIMYELKDPIREILPEGGLMYSLSDGSTILSNRYANKMTYKKDTGLISYPGDNENTGQKDGRPDMVLQNTMLSFTNSPYGDPDVQVMVSNISSVTRL